MNKNKFLIILIIVVVLGFLIIGFSQNKNNTLKEPTLGKNEITQVSPTPTPTLAPPVAPKTYDFNSSTDLKSELQKVNPQVLDSDFQ